MNCSYCQKINIRNLSIAEIFMFQKITQHSLCKRCQKKFKRLPKHNCCLGCNKPEVTAYCQECIRWQQKYPNYTFQHQALFYYNEGMKEWFEAYKFKGDYCLRYSFSEQIRTYFKKKKKWCIIPIPISQKKLMQRGFNQVEGLLQAAEIPYHPLLRRTKEDISQVKKTKEQRLALKQPFDFTKAGEKAINEQNVLLIDDVYTTGRTLFHAAEVILQKKPAKLYTFSLAR